MVEKKRKELIGNLKREQGKQKLLSDDVIIEMIHAFRDIMIELIDRRYLNVQ